MNRQDRVMKTVAALKKELDLWVTEDKEVFLTLKGTFKSMPALGYHFRHYVRETYEKLFSTAALIADVEEVLESIQDHARVLGEVRKVCFRVGEKAGVLFYDALGHFVKFEGGKWDLVDACEITFVHGGGTQGQVKPVSRGIRLPELLNKYVPTKNQKDMALIISWLIGCFKPGGPYPVLILKGEQGSAKSTTTRVLSSLVDPNSRDMRAPPKDLRDLVTFVKNSFVVAFDNVSRIDEKQSDDYCRLATGHGALGGRALYTDAEDKGFRAVRPMILNGISDFIVRPDLLDRSISVELPSIPQSKRQDDDTFWTNFNADKPAILAALYDAVAKAHQGFETVVIPEGFRIRMSNFCRWAAAAGEALDFPEDFIVEALHSAWNETAMAALDSDPVAIALVNYFQKETSFHGDTSKLMNVLVNYRSTGDESWPQTPRGLTSSIQRLLPILRKSGIMFYANGRDRKTRRSVFELRLEQPDGSGETVGAL